MFSEEVSSVDIIDTYVKLFLSAVNAFGKAVKNSSKKRKGLQQKMKKLLSFYQQQTFSVY